MMKKWWLFLALALAAPLYAQDGPALPDLLRSNDYQGLESFLAAKAKDPDFPALEKSVMDQVRQFVFRNNEEGAIKLLEILLRVNMDNGEAQDLYLALDATRKERAEAAKKKEQEETARRAAEQEKLRVAEEKRKAAEEESRKLREEAEKQERIKVIGWRNFSLDLFAAPAIGYIVSSAGKDYAEDGSARTIAGPAVAVDVRFDHPYVFASLETTVEWFPVTVSGGTLSPIYVKPVFCFGTPLLPLPVSLRAGFLSMYEKTTSEAERYLLFTGVNTSTIGFGVKDWDLRYFKLSTFFDFFLAPFSDRDMKYGFEYGVGLSKKVFTLLGRPLIMSPRFTGFLIDGRDTTEQSFRFGLYFGTVFNGN